MNKKYILAIMMTTIMALMSVSNLMTVDEETTFETQAEQDYSSPEPENTPAITAGDYHTCAILDDGSVRCWGRNSYGQLGDGTNTDRNTPTALSSWPSGRTAVAITAGGYHTCAILDDGSVRCWGYNMKGHLGDGTNTDRNTPTALSSWPSGRTAVAITAGSYHTCAILDDGSVRCWGRNSYGQLGVGTNTDRNTPTALSSWPSGRTAVAITVGNYHTCAILDDGSVRCWGYNMKGQLGDGTNTDRNTPTALSSWPSGRTAVAITGGYFHTCAILDDGSVRCWGRNAAGQLGDGTTTNRNTPTALSSWPSGRTAVAITAGGSHTCAILDDGSVRCWGYNNRGQLGDGTNTDRNTQTLVSLPLTELDEPENTPQFLASGGSHTCAVNRAINDESPNQLTCWGDNTHGQIGDSISGVVGEEFTRNLPRLVQRWRADCSVSHLLEELVQCWDDVVILQIASGLLHSCAIVQIESSDPKVQCWGGNPTGSLFDLSIVNNYASAQGAIPPISITVGSNHNCAIMENGKLICWGDNRVGQIGTSDIRSGTNIVDLGPGRTAIAVTAGSSHTCAVLDDGDLKCWGLNYMGQIGDGTSRNNRFTPTSVFLGEEMSVIDVAAGDDFTCAIFANHHIDGITVLGQIKCWGKNLWYSGSWHERPISPEGYGGPQGDMAATSITAGGSFACAILDDESTICWGDNSKGQLGDGNICRVGVDDFSNGCDGRGGREEMTVVKLGSNERIVAISAGSSHACATLYSGIVECWGNNENGQLGDGTRITRGSSAPVKFVSISTGDEHSCAITPGSDNVRNLKCWGRATHGQLGIPFEGTDEDDPRTYWNIPYTHSPTTVDLGVIGYPWRPKSAVAVATGALHTCVLTNEGRVMCWGSNWYGQLGLWSGGPEVRLTPSPNAPANQDGYVWLGGEEDDWDFVGNIIAVDISAGAYHTCATLVDDSVKCWGRNDKGQLGDGTRCSISHASYGQTTEGCNGRGGKEWPSLVDLPTDSVTTDYGMISVTTEVPQGKVLAIDGGLHHTCAIFDSGADSNPVSMKCWGSNSKGQLGCGPMCGDQLSPIAVEFASGLQLLGAERKSPIDIDVGRYHSCATLDDGTTKCWGYNNYGQLGAGWGAFIDGIQYLPRDLITTRGDLVTTREMTFVRGGGYHTCGVDTGGRMQCWGHNGNGELGDGSEVGRLTPANVDGLSGDKVIDMDLGYGHTCAVLSNSYSGIGTIKCWGSNHYSQLGDGTECANSNSDPCKSTTNGYPKENQPVEVQFELFSMITDTSGAMRADDDDGPGTVDPIPQLPPPPQPPGTGSEYPPCGSTTDVGNGMSITRTCNAQQGNNGGSNSTSSNGTGNQTGCPDGTTLFEYESLLLCVSNEIDPNMLKDEELLKNATFLAPEVVEDEVEGDNNTSNTQNTGGLESNFFTLTGPMLLGLMLLLIGMYNNRKKKDDDEFL